MVTIPDPLVDAHSPLTESNARKSGETIAPAEGQLVNPYEYKLINGVYFVRYLVPTKDTGLYDEKKMTFDRHSGMMSICDERGFVYVGIVQDPDTSGRIGRTLRNKGFAGFEDRVGSDVKTGVDYNYRNSGHHVPLSSRMGGSTELATAIGQAHIWHTQFSANDKARRTLADDKGVKI